MAETPDKRPVPVDPPTPSNRPASKDVRAYDRYSIKLRLRLHILLPEETFTPLDVPAIATEVSQLGLRVKTPLISKDLAERLHKGPAWVKLELESPRNGQKLTIKTRPFWAKYYPEGVNERAYAELGFSLKDLAEEDRIGLEDLVRDLMEQGRTGT